MSSIEIIFRSNFLAILPDRVVDHRFSIFVHNLNWNTPQAQIQPRRARSTPFSMSSSLKTPPFYFSEGKYVPATKV